MIPAPDAMRCDARHPSSSLYRCFKNDGHIGAPGCHQHEDPVLSETYHAKVVRQWWTSPPVSEFPTGPCVD